MTFSSWRGTVGLIKPTMRPGSMEETVRLLPEGVGLIPIHQNVRAGTIDEFGAAISPTGEWLAYNSNESGRFEVSLEYACTPEEAGSGFEVRCGSDDATLEASVESTGSWDAYATRVIGEIELEPGVHRVSVHSRKPSGPLMKLRSLRIAPRR